LQKKKLDDLNVLCSCSCVHAVISRGR